MCMTRRSFGRAVACGSLATFATRAASAADNPWYRQINYSVSKTFTQRQYEIIQRAMRAIAERMLDPRMCDNAINQKKDWHYAVHNVEGSGAWKGSKEQFLNWFKNVQLPVLREKGFPRLQLLPEFAKDSGWAAWAPVGTMKTYFESPKDGFSLRPFASVTGTFEVTLNTSLIGDPGYSLGSDSDYWAGVICHEMLHNLGHEHAKGDYDSVFIRRYQNAVRFSGKYVYDPAFGLAGNDRGEATGCPARRH